MEFEKQVYQALKQSPEIDATHIRIKVRDLNVTLLGTVSKPQAARAVRTLVENFPEVKSVIDHLHVIEGNEF